MSFTLYLIESLRESGDELIIFESTLGLIQLSSLGEHVIQIIKNKGIINTLQNNMLENNEFTIHASLELLVNIFSQDQELQTKLDKVLYFIFLIYKSLLGRFFSFEQNNFRFIFKILRRALPEERIKL